MNEQQIRDEIDAAREIKFPSNQANQLKVLLEDIYYKSVNEEKLLAATCAEDKKEHHIQNILTATAAAEALEIQLVQLEPSWTRPSTAMIDFSTDSIIPNNHSQKFSGNIAHFSDQVTVSGIPIDLKGPTAAWPVGSVFLSVISTNPSVLLGFGAWQQVSEGRVLVGVDTADPDFDAAEKTGGAKNKTLSSGEMPSHTHAVTDPGHTHTQNPHTHSITGGSAEDTSGPLSGIDASTTTTTAIGAGIGNTTATNNSATTSISVNSAGSGQSFSIMNPFFSIWVWKRVS